MCTFEKKTSRDRKIYRKAKVIIQLDYIWNVPEMSCNVCWAGACAKSRILYLEHSLLIQSDIGPVVQKCQPKWTTCAIMVICYQVVAESGCMLNERNAFTVHLRVTEQVSSVVGDKC